LSDDQAIESFWDRVAFSNFVQRRLLGARTDRPTRADWQTGWQVFTKTVEELKPNLVIALGKELWEKGLQPGDFQRPDLNEPRLDQWAQVYVGGNGSEMLAGAIAHPSGFGWKYEHWDGWVRRLLDASSAKHRSR
jgi:hypothetical protein